MKIAVIGAGNFGGAFAAAAVRAGHEVTVTAPHEDRAAKVAAEIGATAVANDEAVARADVVILAIPGTAVAGWAGEHAARLGAAVIVDATNPIAGDFSDLLTQGTSAAETLQERLPDAAVVKAFNTVFASRLGNPVQDGTPLDVFLAGDREPAKATVSQLARSLGFTPRDAGRLRMARGLEEMAFLHITLNATNGWVWQSAWQLVGPTAA